MVNSLWVCQARLISGMSPTAELSPPQEGIKSQSQAGGAQLHLQPLPLIPWISPGSCHVPPVHREELQRCLCLHPQLQQLQPLPAPCSPAWELQGHPWLWKGHWRVHWRLWKQEPPQLWRMPEDLCSWKRWWLLRTCRFWCWPWDLLWVWWGSCWSLWVWWWPWIPCWGHP